MAIKQALFNGTATKITGGLTVSVARNTGTTVVPRIGGCTSVAADTARYAAEYSLFYPAPVVEVVNNTASPIRAMFSGISTTGNPLCIVRLGAEGASSMLIYQDAAWPTTPTLLRTVTMLGNGTDKPSTMDDILVGQTDEDPDMMFSPRGGFAAGGLIVLACMTFRYVSGSRGTASSWFKTGVAQCYSRDNGATWNLAYHDGLEPSAQRSGTITNISVANPTVVTCANHGLSTGYTIVVAGSNSTPTINGSRVVTVIDENTFTIPVNVTVLGTAGTWTCAGSDGFLSDWSVNGQPGVRGNGRDEIWAVVASYANGTMRSASSFLNRFRKIAGVWTPEAAVRLSHITIGVDKTHVHTGIVEIQDDMLSYVAHVGDTQTDSRDERHVCDSAEDYLDGLTLRPDGVNCYDVPVIGDGNWTAPVIINSSLGYEGAQPISAAPARADKGYVLGADEGGGGQLNYATYGYVAQSDPLNYVWAYGQQTTDTAFSNWRCFTAAGNDPFAINPLVSASIVGGSVFNKGGADYTDCARIVAKPSGLDEFGVVYAPQGQGTAASQQRGVPTASGNLWFGSNDASGLRRVKVATPRRVRPLQAGMGGTNYARKTLVQRTAPAAGNTVTLNATPPSTPPGDGEVLRLVCGLSNAAAGRFSITHDEINKTHSVCVVQVWIYNPAVGESGATDINEDSWRARLTTQEGGAGGIASAYKRPFRVDVRGSWFLLTFQFTNGVSGDWDLSAQTAPLELVIGFQAGNGAIHPVDVFMQIAGVFLDPPSPANYAIACPATAVGGTVGPNEVATLSGFTCGDAWTAEIQCQTSRTGRDCMWHAVGTYRTMAILREASGIEVRIEWDADTKLRITTVNDTDDDTVEITSLPKGLRCDPLSLAIAWDGTDYVIRAAVGGSVVQTATIASATAVVKPVSLVCGESDAVEVAYVRVVEDEALTGSAMEDRLEAGLPLVADDRTLRNRSFRNRGIRPIIG
jgi:hypothetical protein